MSGCPQLRTIPLSHTTLRLLDEVPAALVMRASFEPSKMKQGGFDNFAEQSWTEVHRDLAAMMAERAIVVSHTTIMRWVPRCVPEFEKCWDRYARPASTSCRMDETAASVRGGLHYVYRAVDKQGKSVGSLLQADRGMDAAREFLRKPVAANGSRWPTPVKLDGNAANHRALRLLGDEEPKWRSVDVRSCRDLNNFIEQDHRANKSSLRIEFASNNFHSGSVNPPGR
jgi:transposase-like protein